MPSRAFHGLTRCLSWGPPAPEPERYVFRTQPEGTRSGPGDTDLVLYGLRRYLGLATKGNPTALLPLYAPPESVLLLTALGEELRALAPALHGEISGIDVVRAYVATLGGHLDIVATLGDRRWKVA